VLAGGEADDGPKVKDRDRDDARADPIPELLRGTECWSGEAEIERPWMLLFLSAVTAPARDATGGVVPVE